MDLLGAIATGSKAQDEEESDYGAAGGKDDLSLESRLLRQGSAETAARTVVVQ